MAAPRPPAAGRPAQAAGRVPPVHGLEDRDLPARLDESGLAAAQTEYARSVAIQNEIWAGAVAAARETPHANIVLLPALNAMIDITTTRLAATQFHPPRVVYIVLGVISLACAFLVGYEMGASEARSWAHVVVLAVLLSFTLYVILDFEYPRLGLIRVDDFDALIAQVRASMG